MDASYRAAQRCMEEWAPRSATLADSGAPLELAVAPAQRPRLISAPVIEGHGLRSRCVEGDVEIGFSAFLDGTQTSRVLAYHDGLPLVFGTVAAVIRVRVNRRMYTWNRGPEIRRRVYLPCAYLPDALAQHYSGRGFDVVDTTCPDDGSDSVPTRHPFDLLERAVHLVQSHREAAERVLAEAWCELERLPICMDGGTSISDVTARAPCTVGVVKSHRTLYVEEDALERVFRLRKGERSSVFRITSPRRTPVASWYLRLRDPEGRDPLWGLVRVEAADPAHADERTEALTARADRISRWILAEAAPVALPDARWDRMMYGVRDCEEFLRAIV